MSVTLLRRSSRGPQALLFRISDFYTNWRAERPVIGMFGQDWTIPEPTIAEYEEKSIFENAAAYSDTAMLVIACSPRQHTARLRLARSSWARDNPFSQICLK